MATSPPLTPSSPAPLMTTSTQSLRTAAAATMASPLGRRRAATGTRGRTRWRAMRGCTTSRPFQWRRTCCLRTETNWRWSTADSPPCPHSAACCKNNTGPCLCPSGPASIQTREGNPAASRYPGTAGFMLFWLLPLLHRIRGSPISTSWTGPEAVVRHTPSLFHIFTHEPQAQKKGEYCAFMYHTGTKTVSQPIIYLIYRKLTYNNLSRLSKQG